MTLSKDSSAKLCALYWQLKHQEIALLNGILEGKVTDSNRLHHKLKVMQEEIVHRLASSYLPDWIKDAK